MDSFTTNSCPVPNGILLIIGGHENKGELPEKTVQEENFKPRAILEKFVNLIGKKDCKIEVVTTASSEGEESFSDYEKAFKELGVNAIGHLHHEKRADAMSQEIVERIKNADGVFFSGGDQLKLTSIYGGTEFIYQLKQRYIYEGLTISGTSAGAMAFSTPMIFAGNKEVQQIAGEVRITTGLEFLKDVCIDTHFVDRGRFVRMAQVIATNPTCIGIGIEEDTAVILRNGIEAEVIGSGVAIVIEGFGITDSNITRHGKSERIYIHDLNVKLLSEGCHYRIPRNNPPHL
jgi:cyanophycinase